MSLINSIQQYRKNNCVSFSEKNNICNAKKERQNDYYEKNVFIMQCES